MWSRAHAQRNKTVSKHTDVDGVSQYTTLRGEDLPSGIGIEPICGSSSEFLEIEIYTILLKLKYKTRRLNEELYISK